MASVIHPGAARDPARARNNGATAARTVIGRVEPKAADRVRVERVESEADDDERGVECGERGQDFVLECAARGARARASGQRAVDNVARDAGLARDARARARVHDALALGQARAGVEAVAALVERRVEEVRVAAEERFGPVAVVDVDVDDRDAPRAVARSRVERRDLRPPRAYAPRSRALARPVGGRGAAARRRC